MQILHAFQQLKLIQERKTLETSEQRWDPSAKYFRCLHDGFYFHCIVQWQHVRTLILLTPEMQGLLAWTSHIGVWPTEALPVILDYFLQILITSLNYDFSHRSGHYEYYLSQNLELHPCWNKRQIYCKLPKYGCSACARCYHFRGFVYCSSHDQNDQIYLMRVYRSK